MKTELSLDTVVLQHGSHTSPAEGVCAMEMVAYLAREPHSDSPACTSPVIAAFMRAWNDAIPDDETRTRLLKPVLPRLIGTVGSSAVEQRRADLAFDWMVRVSTPVWLDLAKLHDEAAALRALPPLLDRSAVLAGAAALRALPPLLDRSAVLAAQAALDRARERAAAAWAAARAAAWAAARAAAWDAARDAARAAAWDAARAAAWAAARAAAWDAAWDAARDAARDAAWDAAWDAARDAARDAAWDAARAAAWDAARAAAWDAAWDAARDAARDAAWDAARAAASNKLKPTVEQLQISALDLLDRMIAVTDADVAA